MEEKEQHYYYLHQPPVVTHSKRDFVLDMLAGSLGCHDVVHVAAGWPADPSSVHLGGNDDQCLGMEGLHHCARDSGAEEEGTLELAVDMIRRGKDVFAVEYTQKAAEPAVGRGELPDEDNGKVAEPPVGDKGKAAAELPVEDKGKAAAELPVEDKVKAAAELLVVDNGKAVVADREKVAVELPVEDNENAAVLPAVDKGKVAEPHVEDKRKAAVLRVGDKAKYSELHVGD